MFALNFAVFLCTERNTPGDCSHIYLEIAVGYILRNLHCPCCFLVALLASRLFPMIVRTLTGLSNPFLRVGLFFVAWHLGFDELFAFLFRHLH